MEKLQGWGQNAPPPPAVLGLKNLGTKSLKEVSSVITKIMTSFFFHQEKSNSFSKRLKKASDHNGSIWETLLTQENNHFGTLTKFHALS